MPCTEGTGYVLDFGGNGLWKVVVVVGPRRMSVILSWTFWSTVTSQVDETGSGSCLVADSDVGSIDSACRYVWIKKISKWLCSVDKWYFVFICSISALGCPPVN